MKTLPHTQESQEETPTSFPLVQSEETASCSGGTVAHCAAPSKTALRLRPWWLGVVCVGLLQLGAPLQAETFQVPEFKAKDLEHALGKFPKPEAPRWQAPSANSPIQFETPARPKSKLRLIKPRAGSGSGLVVEPPPGIDEEMIIPLEA